MHSLKGIIFSLRDVLAHKGKQDTKLLEEVVKLLKFLISKNVQPVLVTNRAWEIKLHSGKKEPFQQYLSGLVGQELPYYQGGVDMDFKQTRNAMETILKNHNWEASEVFYVGNTADDVKAASNGVFPLLNAKWHEDNTPYGFTFKSPKEIARFIDCCCLIPKDWFWSIEEEGLRVYSIAPLASYSQRYPNGKIYSEEAKNSLKNNCGDLRFWGLLMAARIHLSGIGNEVNFVAPYPGHKTDSEKSVLMNGLHIIAGSLRVQFVVDLIMRHTNAPKSQILRNQKQNPKISNQLNSIQLNPTPIKPGGKNETYKNKPNIQYRTVLVVDDICTQGYSLEAARIYLKAANANVILLTWLKTPGKNNYHAVKCLDPQLKNPFKKNKYSEEKIKLSEYNFLSNVKNEHADREIAKAYKNYKNWEWPESL